MNAPHKRPRRKTTPSWWLKQGMRDREARMATEMDAFKRGEAAYHRGSSFTANPFSKEAKNSFWDLWGFGWEAGLCDDRKKGKNRCKGCGFEISMDSDLCGECICEEDAI